MEKSNIESCGLEEFFKTEIRDEELVEGTEVARVISVQKEHYKLISNIGESIGKLKGSVFYNNKAAMYPTVGDFVLIKANPIGEDVIYKVLERKSKFSRLDSFNENEQLVAANFDYVFILSSLNKDFNIRRIERYIVSAWQSGGIPVVILTKKDLCENCRDYEVNIEEIAPGVDVMSISSYTGEGIEELRNYIKPGKTIVFLGSSGVGKSSLVNVLLGEEKMLVKEIRYDDSKGKHTTTHRELFMLSNGGIIIDTPGMRELGLWKVSQGIETAFPEIEALALQCRFTNCNHDAEPGCAIKNALENGELSEDRWNNYIKLKKEAAFAEKKDAVSRRIKEKQVGKGKAKHQKQMKKIRRSDITLASEKSLSKEWLKSDEEEAWGDL